MPNTDLYSKKVLICLLIFVCLTYLGVGATAGFIQGGLAPIIRKQQNVDLSYLGLIFILYLPLTLSFLWASKVDSWHIKFLGRRCSWILPLQILCLLLTLLIAFLKPEKGYWSILFFLTLIFTTATATIDLAIDAFCVDYIKKQHKKYLATIKIASLSMGTVLGGGVLVYLYPSLQWHKTILVFSIISFIAIIFIGPLMQLERKVEKIEVKEVKSNKISIFNLMKEPLARERLIKMSMLMCVLFISFGLNRLLLVDMQVPLETIGWLLGIVSPIINSIVCGLIAVFTFTRFKLALLSFGLIAIMGQLLVIIGLAYQNILWLEICVLISPAAVAAMYVLLSQLILIWASGDQSATDYSLLYQVGRLLGLVMIIFLPAVVSYTGWYYFQIIIILLFAMALAYFLTSKQISQI